MTWKRFAYNNLSAIMFVSGKMNSQAYQRVLESHFFFFIFFPNVSFFAGENLKFHPKNSPAHASNRTKLWFVWSMFKL